MKSEKYLLIYIIAILCCLLIVSGFGYFNYKNKSFTGLDKNTTYKEGKRIKYAGLNWYVVSDDNSYVTLILAKNAKTGIFGASTDYSKSEISKYLNNTWIKDLDQRYLKEELDRGALVADSKSNSYIRLIKIEELSENPIKNDSNTPYWTMSEKNGSIYYALNNGDLKYTSYNVENSGNVNCYKGNNGKSIKDISIYNKIVVLTNNDTLVKPNEEKAITKVEASDEKTDTCYDSYKISNGLFASDGHEVKYTSGWEVNEIKEEIGIRPVITVKKK